MDISSVIIVSLGLLLIIFFLVMSLELILPLKMHLELVKVVRPHLIEFESTLAIEVDELKGDLEKIGFKDVTIIYDESRLRYGDKVRVRVQCKLEYVRMLSLFKRTNDEIDIVYEKKIRVRQILN